MAAPESGAEAGAAAVIVAADLPLRQRPGDAGRLATMIGRTPALPERAVLASWCSQTPSGAYVPGRPRPYQPETSTMRSPAARMRATWRRLSATLAAVAVIGP